MIDYLEVDKAENRNHKVSYIHHQGTIDLQGKQALVHSVLSKVQPHISGPLGTQTLNVGRI